MVAMVAVELIVTVAATATLVMSAGRIDDDVPPFSTLLVLGSLVSDGEPGDYVRGRLDAAIDLYRTGNVVRIINSGNGSAAAGNEPAVMRDYLQARGVAPGVIVDDPLGVDTEASCRRARDVFGVTRLTVVTQDFHLRRAIALCRSRGIDVRGVAAPCPCPTVGIVRNHLREVLFAQPRALVSIVFG